MELALLMWVMYFMGFVSVAAIALLGMHLALQDGMRYAMGYLVALGAVLLELARIGLRA